MRLPGRLITLGLVGAAALGLWASDKRTTLMRPAFAQPACPTTNSQPPLVPGGSVFGKIASQWQTYFGQKADANNGVLCNPTIIGGTVPGAFTIAPGNTSAQGTRNNGSQTISSGATLFPQLNVVTKSANYTANTDNGGISDSGALLVATGAGVTFKFPNPSSATRGTRYFTGSDGVHSYVVSTVTGSASFYGCPGGISTNPSLGLNVGTVLTDDGTNYACLAWGGGSASFANPSATAGPSTVNGSATTAMRSDAAPAVQLGTSGQPGIVQCGTGTTCSGGTLSVSGGVASKPQGRLTLTSGSPVLAGDVTSATTVYYDSYEGNQVPVGATLGNLTITSNEISFGLSTSHVISGSIYDIFAVNNSGSLAGCVGPAWSSNTARGSGGGTTQIDQTNGGIWTNTNSLTHCWGGASGTTDYGTVAAHAGTYLGSLYATANGQTAMMFGPNFAAGGAANVLGLYNAYNRVQFRSTSNDVTATWTYNSTTWRNADASASNRITYLDGLAQSPVSASYDTTCQIGGVVAVVGVSFDGNTPVGVLGNSYQTYTEIAAGSSLVALGLHYAQAQEAIALTYSGTATFFGFPFGGSSAQQLTSLSATMAD